jgi:hypothetical protein
VTLYGRFWVIPEVQHPGGIFWNGYGAAYYERPAGNRPDEETVRRFVKVCPPFRALILGACMAQYERSVRDLSVGKSYRAGRADLLMSVYLPYCDQFITSDPRQERCLREISAAGDLTTRVLSYASFRAGLIA